MRELSSSPQPLIRGALRQTPLAEFLVQAYDGGLEGTLLLQTPERQKSAILFVRGAPAKARPAVNTVFLGKVAADLGLIENAVASSTRRRAEAERKPHGEILRDEGHLDETGLYLALREQLKRQVLDLCQLPDTTGFGFYEANYLADWGPAGEWRVKPLPMMWRALVDHLPGARRDAWLARLGNTPLRIRPEAPVSRYALSPQEKGILDMLRTQTMTVDALSESGVGSRELVRKVACALLLSRQIDIGSEKDPVGLHEPAESPASIPPPETRAARRGVTLSRPPGAGDDRARGVSLPPAIRHDPASRPRTSTAPRPPSNAPRQPSISPRSPSTGPGASSPNATLRQEIEAYRDRNPQNHYEVLGVDRKADTAAIRTAFFQMARVWHPDRLPADLSDLKPVVTKAFAAMGEAHHVLSDENRRADYNRTLVDDAPDDEQAQVAAILDAAGAFQRAEVLMKKKDFKGALAQAQIAYEGDSSQADHVALYAWLKSMAGTPSDELIDMLNAALKQNGDNVRALWYRAQLLKKSGKHLLALKDFKKIVELKPNHVEAQRELRVHTMRKKSGGNTQNSGFFGVFKKKD